MVKVFLLLAILATFGGTALSYFVSYHQSKSALTKYIGEVERSDYKRRETLCREVDEVVYESPSVAVDMVEKSIKDIRDRKELRWQK